MSASDPFILLRVRLDVFLLLLRYIFLFCFHLCPSLLFCLITTSAFMNNLKLFFYNLIKCVLILHSYVIVKYVLFPLNFYAKQKIQASLNVNWIIKPIIKKTRTTSKCRIKMSYQSFHSDIYHIRNLRVMSTIVSKHLSNILCCNSSSKTLPQESLIWNRVHLKNISSQFSLVLVYLSFRELNCVLQ